MSSKTALFALAAGLVLAAPTMVFADGPHPVNYNWHEPNDLKAYDPPGPTVAVDGQGEHLTAIVPGQPYWTITQSSATGPGRALGIEPGGPADAALASDPNAVRWPTLDKSIWETTKASYTITPR